MPTFQGEKALYQSVVLELKKQRLKSIIIISSCKKIFLIVYYRKLILGKILKIKNFVIGKYIDAISGIDD